MNNIKYLIYVISRLWNKLAFSVVWLGIKLIWDQTKRNKDLIKGIKDELDNPQYILTNLP